jgi:hypothetical protein
MVAGASTTVSTQALIEVTFPKSQDLLHAQAPFLSRQDQLRELLFSCCEKCCRLDF